MGHIWAKYAHGIPPGIPGAGYDSSGGSGLKRDPVSFSISPFPTLHIPLIPTPAKQVVAMMSSSNALSVA